MDRLIISIMKEYGPEFVENEIDISKEELKIVNDFGKAVTARDLVWSLLSKISIIYAKKGKWGLFRNAHLRMGQIFEAQGKFKQYLSKCLQVCYLDIGGPVDNMYLDFPDIKPPTKFFAPGIITDIKRMVEEMKLDERKTEALFLENSKVLEESLPMAMSSQEAWLKLRESIFTAS